MNASLNAGPTANTFTVRSRPLPSTDALPETTGTECSTYGACSTAAASSRLNGRTEFSTPGEIPKVLVLPGLIASVCVPNCVNCSTT